MTNLPDYALERRPGDPTDLARSAWELVVFHTTIRDARTIAALLDAGSAALAYAPGGGAVELNSRRRDVELGHAAAEALRAEAERVHQRNEDRYRTIAKRDAKESRRIERERARGVTPFMEVGNQQRNAKEK